MIGSLSATSGGDSQQNISSELKEEVHEIRKTFKAAATTKEQLAVISSAFKNGLLFTPIDKHGNTLFHFFVSRSELVNLYTLFAGLGPDEINSQNDQGETVLDQAAIYGRQTLVHALVNHGAKTNIVKPSDFKNIIFAEKYLVDCFNVKTKVTEYAYDLDKMLEYIAELAKKDITFSTPIDCIGNTLFQILVFKCGLFVLAKVFKLVTLAEVDCQNDFGQTALMQMARANRRVKMNCLLTLRAQTTIRDRKNRFAYHYNEPIGFSIDNFLDAQLFYYQACDELDLPTGVEKIIKMGFRLDSPINEHDETLLHFLVDRAPMADFIKILQDYSLPTTNWNAISYFARTPLDLACKLNRYSVVEFLISKGATPDESYKSEKTVKYLINQELLRTQYQDSKVPPLVGLTFLEKIADIYHEQLKSHLPIMQATSIFTRFISFIKELKLKYSPIKRREGKNLLECNIEQEAAVNCADLATAFGYLLKAIGLSKVSIYAYKNIQSKDFRPKPDNIYGEFTCFDQQFHDENFASEGYYGFEDHYVVKAYGRFFDPTFCCYYDNARDIEYDESETSSSAMPSVSAASSEPLAEEAALIAEIQKLSLGKKKAKVLSQP